MMWHDTPYPNTLTLVILTPCALAPGARAWYSSRKEHLTVYSAPCASSVVKIWWMARGITPAASDRSKPSALLRAPPWPRTGQPDCGAGRGKIGCRAGQRRRNTTRLSAHPQTADFMGMPQDRRRGPTQVRLAAPLCSPVPRP